MLHFSLVFWICAIWYMPFPDRFCYVFFCNFQEICVFVCISLHLSLTLPSQMAEHTRSVFNVHFSGVPPSCARCLGLTLVIWLLDFVSWSSFVFGLPGGRAAGVIFFQSCSQMPMFFNAFSWFPGCFHSRINCVLLRFRSISRNPRFWF